MRRGEQDMRKAKHDHWQAEERQATSRPAVWLARHQHKPQSKVSRRNAGPMLGKSLYIARAPPTRAAHSTVH